MLLRILIVLAVLLPGVLAAQEASPSDGSVRELLQVAQVHNIFDNVMAQMETMIKSTMQQVMQGRPMTAQEQKIFARSRAEVMAMVREDLSWAKLEPMYLRVYEKSLTQGEVDGMIAFYKTPAGRAVINKMPLILQNTMQEMSGMMGPMVQRIQRMQDELIAEVEAEKTKGPKS